MKTYQSFMRHFLSFMPLILFTIFICACNNKKPEKEVRQTIHQFGKQLKKVSVLAPDSLIISQTKQVYKPYVTQKLLQSWVDHPSKVPGRKTSSPWPKKINIIQVSKINDLLYKVKGKVIYITSKEKVQGGQAKTKRVLIEIKKMKEGRWKISKYSSVN